jgi:hypothetical protein
MTTTVALGAHREAGPLVAILHQNVPEDAPADERDTLIQVEAVEESLRALGYGTERLLFDLDLTSVIDRLRTLAPRWSLTWWNR